MEDLRRIGDEIARKISECQNIKAVAYVGSVASAFADEYSKDVDLVCLCSKFPSIEERRKYLGKQNYNRTTMASKFMEFLKVDDIQVDISFALIGWLELSSFLHSSSFMLLPVSWPPKV